MKSLGEAIGAVKKINGPHDIDGLFAQCGVDPEEFYVELLATWPSVAGGNFSAGFVAGCLYQQGRDDAAKERAID